MATPLCQRPISVDARYHYLRATHDLLETHATTTVYPPPEGLGTTPPFKDWDGLTFWTVLNSHSTHSDHQNLKDWDSGTVSLFETVLNSQLTHSVITNQYRKDWDGDNTVIKISNSKMGHR